MPRVFSRQKQILFCFCQFLICCFEDKCLPTYYSKTRFSRKQTILTLFDLTHGTELFFDIIELKKKKGNLKTRTNTCPPSLRLHLYSTKYTFKCMNSGVGHDMPELRVSGCGRKHQMLARRRQLQQPCPCTRTRTQCSPTHRHHPYSGRYRWLQPLGKQWNIDPSLRCFNFTK